MSTTILGISLKDRQKNAVHFQEVLSKHCNLVKTRLGLHDVKDGQCATSGIILLELIGNDADKLAFEKELGTVTGVNLQKMVF